MTVNVTGTARRPDGSLYANATFLIVPAPAIVRALDGSVIAPTVTTVQTDAQGAVSFAILPGNYIATETGTGKRLSLAIPDAATADFAACVDAPDIPAFPDVVTRAESAATRAEVAAAGISSSYQPLDGDLTSLAAASATGAMYYRSAASTWSPVTIGANITFAGGTLSATGGGGGVTDGDKGDVIVTGSGASWALDYAAVNPVIAPSWSNVTSKPTTDGITEGTTNLYFGSGRVRTSALTGFSAAASRAAIIATDTVLSAFNKCQKYFNDLSALAFSGAWSDISGKPTTLSGYGITDGITASAVASGYQPLDAGLTALGGLSSPGLYYLSAADTWSAVSIGANLSFTGGTLAASGGSATWGSIGGTLASQTDLQSALNGKAALATTLSGYGITDRARPQNIPASGEAILLSAGVAGTALSTTVGTAGRIDLFPYITPVTIAATAFQVNVTTGGASSVGRVLIYAADSSGNPAGLLFASADIDISTTGIKTSTLGYTLQAGVLYWIGWQFSNASSPAVSTPPTAMTFDINAGGPSTTAKKALRRVVTYASGPPDPWGYTSSEVNSAVPAAIWAKV